MIAEHDATRTVEGNHYFPPDAVRQNYLARSETHSVFPWKGTASYYTAGGYHSVVRGQRNADAVWYDPQPPSAAAEIARYVVLGACWRGVRIEA